MKNLQRLLIAAAFVSIMPSTVALCSEESTKTVEMNILKNISYFGGASFLTGAVAVKTLTNMKKNLIAALDHKAYSLKEEAVMKQLTKNIKHNKALMGVSCLAILAPVIVPATVDQIIPAIVDKYNEMNEQNKKLDEINAIGDEVKSDLAKELNKETV